MWFSHIKKKHKKTRKNEREQKTESVLNITCNSPHETNVFRSHADADKFPNHLQQRNKYTQSQNKAKLTHVSTLQGKLP